MLTAFLGLNIALRVFMLDAIHTGMETSLAQSNVHPNVYVHLDWRDDPRNIISPLVGT